MTKAIATRRTTAPPAIIWRMWADVERSPRWDVDVKWSRLDGEFAVGTRGELELKSGVRLSFVLDEVVHGRSYANVVRIAGVRVRFTHDVEPISAGEYRVTHAAELGGPLGWLLRPLLRRSLQAALSRALGNMIRLAEEARPCASPSAG
jgi:uncharacterized protein YndB with AHSA1/START domain